MGEMINALNALEMMEAHIHFNLGIYFSDYSSVGGIAIVTSALIPDIYWNYAYNSDLSLLRPEQLSAASSQLEALSRKPTVWQPSSLPVPDSWSVQSKEAWLWLDAVAWQPGPRLKKVEGLVIKNSTTPTALMRSIFENAYSSGGLPGEIGYSTLPPEYGEAYEKGRSTNQDITTQHFSAWLGNNCVAVGSVSVWRNIGGIYSVATHRDYRRRGIATALSAAATTWAMENGVIGVMLQTEADSDVERMYTQLGYIRTHVGHLLSRVT